MTLNDTQKEWILEKHRAFCEYKECAEPPTHIFTYVHNDEYYCKESMVFCKEHAVEGHKIAWANEIYNCCEREAKINVDYYFKMNAQIDSMLMDYERM